MPTVTGTSGDNNLSASDTGGNRLDEVYGLGGADTITARPRAFDSFRYLLDGGDGDDIIRITPNNLSTTVTATIFGGAGNDLIDTQASRNTIDAGSGDDRIYVDAADVGGDTEQPFLQNITLGDGSDYLLLRRINGLTTNSIFVSDFQAGVGGDSLDLVNVLGILQNYGGGNPFVAGYLRLVQSGSDTIVQLDRDGPGGSATAVQNLVTLTGVLASTLTAANFAGFSLDGSNVPGLTLAGGSGADTLTGMNADDTLQGLGGDDTLSGGFGDDRLEGGAGADRLDGGFGSDSLSGGDDNDVLIDDMAGNDHLDGGAGDDTLTIGRTFARAPGTLLLEGGSGNDVLTYTATRGVGQSNLRTSDTITMRGGDGSDTFVLDGGGVFTIETGTGSDIIQRLGGNIAAWTATVTDFTIGAGGDVIAGFPGTAVQMGADTLIGGILLRNVIAGFLDPFNTGGFRLVTIDGTNAADTLIGNTGDNQIHGSGGDDFMDGRGGEDLLVGGAGNDVFVVDSAGDRVVETAGEGFDVIYTDVNYQLPDDASSAVELISARDWYATTPLELRGNSASNILYGNAGANFLDGQGGIDSMLGLAGNDVYVVDNAGDNVYETAGEGRDIVYASVSYALSDTTDVEILSARDWSGTAALSLSGNGLDNEIDGNAGANFLDGRGGADIMVGFGGNDVYVVDNGRDVVYESAGGGQDVVFTTATYALTAGSEVELLSTRDQSATAAIDLYGNAFANELAGNAGVNRLDGGGGADILSGFGGADLFTFTTALGGGNVDWITDFVHASDRIGLDGRIFAGLTAVTADNFVRGSAALDANDRIIFDPGSGALYFDVDGVGGQAAVRFATLSGSSGLDWNDLFVLPAASAPEPVSKANDGPQVLPGLAPPAAWPAFQTGFDHHDHGVGDMAPLAPPPDWFL